MTLVTALRGITSFRFRIDPWRFRQGGKNGRDLESRLEALYENDKVLGDALDAYGGAFQRLSHQQSAAGLTLQTPDGVQFCSVSGLTTSSATPEWTFPTAFIAPPVVTASIVSLDATNFVVNLVAVTSIKVTLQRGRISGGGAADPLTAPLHVIAVGLWKLDP